MLRAEARAGRFTRTTAGLCPDRVHANLVIVPEALALEFRRFCELNPGPCPLIEETPPGVATPRSAPAADVRTDVPRYRVYRDGRLDDEPLDVRAHWRQDSVSFLLGCSFNFERALVRAGMDMRHHSEEKVVPMFVTNRQCRPSGPFEGPIVVSMRPILESRVDEARALTSALPRSHGGPISVGDGADLGIVDLGRPDFGEAVSLRPGEVAAFWECGVTPQAVALHSRLELVVTHAPGHMFVTDLRTESAATGAPGS